MSNLNMEAQQGRLVQATETPVANNVGNRVTRPIETAKEAPGTEGNAQGAMALAQSNAEVAKQINTVVQNGMVQYQNLKIAEEETRKQNHMLDLSVGEKKARIDSRKEAIEQGLTTEQEQGLYQQKLDTHIGDMNNKYQYQTKIGNDIAARVDSWKNGVNVDYQENVILPRFVDNFKAGQMQYLDSLSKNLSSQAAEAKDMGEVGKLLNQAKADIDAEFSKPQAAIVWGGADGAQREAVRRKDAAMKDIIATTLERDPSNLKSVAELKTVLRSSTGDPATDPFFELDPSQRRELVVYVEKEEMRRVAENDRKVKEYQRENEHAYSMDIMSGKLGGVRALVELEKAQYEGKISAGKQEQLSRDIYAKQERDARRAEAAAERSARAAEKRQELLQPARDALTYGLPLDPRVASNRKSVDQLTSDYIKANPNKDPIEVAESIAKRTGIVPSALSAKYYGDVMGKDPAKSVIASQRLNALAAEVPNVIHSLPDEVVSKATQLQMGVHPDQAQANIEKARTLTSEQKKVYEEGAKKGIVKLESNIAKSLGVGKDKVTPEALGHAREIYKKQFELHGGDADAAMRSTELLIHKSYGVSTLTGKPTVMFNAPEGANGSTKWMNDDYKDSLKAFNLKPEETRLKWNEQLGAYDVFNANGTPAFDPVTKQTLHWKPDQAAAMKTQRDAEQKEADKKRAELIQSTPNPILNPEKVDSSSFVPKGMKGTKPVNTTEPKFGKY